MQYKCKLLPLSELLDSVDATIKIVMGQARDTMLNNLYNIQEQQQEWKGYYNKYQRCVAPFKCPHCPAGKCTPNPTPKPSPKPSPKPAPAPYSGKAR